MSARFTLICLAVVLAGGLIATGDSVRGAESSESTTESNTPQNSARLVLESGTHLHTYINRIRTGVLVYEQIRLSRHRVCLVLVRPDSVEWGLAMAHLPEPGITTVGAVARVPLKSEVSAVIDVSTALTTDTRLPGFGTRAGWSVSLEWQKVTDPLALSARIGYSSRTSDALREISVGGTVSLLVNDLVSLSGSASVAGVVNSNVRPALGVSLAYRWSPSDTMYASIDASLAPSDSYSFTLGISHELKEKRGLPPVKAE